MGCNHDQSVQRLLLVLIVPFCGYLAGFLAKGDIRTPSIMRRLVGLKVIGCIRTIRGVRGVRAILRRLL
jgi:hypothetical protein